MLFTHLLKLSHIMIWVHKISVRQCKHTLTQLYCCWSHFIYFLKWKQIKVCWERIHHCTMHAMLLQSEKWNIPYIYLEETFAPSIRGKIFLSFVRRIIFWVTGEKTNKQTNIFHYQLFNAQVNKLLPLLLLLSHWKVLCFRDLCEISAEFSFFFSFSIWLKSLWTNSFFFFIRQPNNVNSIGNERTSE